MKKLYTVSLLIFFAFTCYSQAFKQSEPLAHTFSIIARDPDTGEMAVGVQSHWFSVGTSVCWAEAGVGVVATQSFTNKSFGIRGLEMMKDGKSAEKTLKKLINSDDGKDVRQVAILDAEGNIAAYTGKKCIKYAGDYQGENYSVQANMMLNKEVWPAMAEAFEKSKGLPLAERVVIALEAGQNAGGDIRGKQSAALLVVKGKPTEEKWNDTMIDLRVDDNEEPIKELKRLLQVHRAYEHMNNGDLAVEVNDMTLALQEYGMAQSIFPDNLEMQYWTAVTLANNGKLDDALPIFKKIFEADNNWRVLTERLPASGVLKIDKKDLKKILKLK